MALAASLAGALIDQPQHAFPNEPARFVADHGSLDPGLPAAFGNRFCEEDNGANDFIIVLNVVNEVSGCEF
jgi:hypothetical protein